MGNCTKNEKMGAVDDIFVIVLFSDFTGLAKGNTISLFSFLEIPIHIVLGIMIGTVMGYLFARFFQRVQIRDTIKVLLLLSISFILVTVEDNYSYIIPFSSLISIMFIGIVLQKKRESTAIRLSLIFNKLWVAAEILLFVLVEATVDIKYAPGAGISGIFLILTHKGSPPLPCKA